MSNLNALADAVANTLSHDTVQRRAAENFLNDNASKSPHFPFLLLQLVTNQSAAEHVRHASAVYLKNHTVKVYSGEESHVSSAEAYESIKNAIVDIMLNVSTPVRRQLGEVLSTIVEKDYPVRWPQLIPSLTQKLHTIVGASSAPVDPSTSANIDWSALQGVLETLHAIFDRYPERMRTDELFTEIKYSLMNTQGAVLSLFAIMSRSVEDNLASKPPAVINLVLKSAEVLCKVFYCLSWQDIPEYFEDHLKEFMQELRKLLIFESEVIDKLSDDEPGGLEDLHASVIEIANIYATKYDEEFRQFLPQFMSDTWSLLMRRSRSPKYDLVVTTGIKFLSSVSRSPDYHLFKDPSTLSGVCNQIVIPNIAIRDEDVEMFEDDPREYVRHDLEGSDTGTRRRGAVELVKGLCVHYEKEVTDTFASYVQSMLAPQVDWRNRDTAIYLVIALGWKSGTLMRGVTETSSLINVVDFFVKFVRPELVESAKNAGNLASPILTADLIKYVISFRNQIPVDGCKDVLAVCGNLLGAREPVVRCYAAACMERILTMKVGIANGNGNGASGNAPIKKNPRLMKGDIEPFLPSLLPAVVLVLRDTSRPDEYMMRLVLRLSTFCKEGMGVHVDALLPVLVELFKAATANPANPLFNHYLFETFAALIRFNATPQTIGSFEGHLVSPLCDVLVGDVTEFGPYVFQILSQLMSVHSGQLPAQYATLMNPTLNPAMWDRRAYVGGMVQFICAYLPRNSKEVIRDHQLQATLGVFQKLIASKATDHYGLQVLSAVFETFDIETLKPFVTAIFNALMVRLSKAKTTKYVSNLMCSLSTFVLRFGAEVLREAFESFDPNVLSMLLKQVWLPDVVKIRNIGQRRLCSLALTEMTCNIAFCGKEPYLQMWPDMVMANIALMEGIVVEQTYDLNDVEDDDDDIEIVVGAAETYSTTHSHLKWGLGSSMKAPALADKQDARFVMVGKVKDLITKNKTPFGVMFHEKVDPKARVLFLKYST